MLPTPICALFEALRFEERRTAALQNLNHRDWQSLLALCDRTQLTLPLAEACPEALPAWVRRRIEHDLGKTQQRSGRVRESYLEIAGRLRHANLEFVVLKGFASAPHFVPEPGRRVQYDLDMYLPPESIAPARDALLDLGYEPVVSLEKFPTDHLPVMIRKTGWQWRGDFFDPDIPVSVDLHFRLWDQETERFAAPGWQEFWRRRTVKSGDGLCFPALCDADAVAYHCMHLLRHLLRGSLRLSHVYELGYFLEHHADEDVFWQDWASLHGSEMQRLQAITFGLARSWFCCRLSPIARQAVDTLPAEVRYWLARYGDSPAASLVSPNKHELWLHLSLLESWPDRGRVLRRRLLPVRLHRPLDTVFVPDEELTVWLRWRSGVRLVAHLVRRFLHHSRALPAVAGHGALWLWRNSKAAPVGAGYWRFLGAASLFNLGSFVFLLVYNLYLLDLGYREDLLGQVSGAMTAGSIAGTLPAAGLLRRAGPRGVLVPGFVALATFSVCRVLIVSRPALIGFAFLAGGAFTLFAVTVAPAIAHLSTETTRPRAFSIFFATGISLGIAGGLLGGRLPALLGSKQATLLVGCGLMALAALPALTLDRWKAAASENRTYPQGPFIRRFLVMIAAWSLATGTFNPFFNAFFARRFGAGVPQIGVIYAAAQLAQVGAMLLAPYVLRRAGLAPGVAGMQLASALALVALLVLPSDSASIALAGTAYAAYMAFHFMGEPGLFSLLMNRVAPDRRSGASSLNFLATFSGQAAAAVVAGAVVARSGYTPVLAAAAFFAVLAALLLWRFLPEPSE